MSRDLAFDPIAGAAGAATHNFRPTASKIAEGVRRESRDVAQDAPNGLVASEPRSAADTQPARSVHGTHTQRAQWREGVETRA